MYVSPVPARATGTSSVRGDFFRRLLAEERRSGPLPLLVWLGLLVGIVLVAGAYAYAAIVFNTQLQYHLFWLGVLVFTLPAFLRLCMAETPRAERLAIITAVALFDYIPKFLRDPQYPLFHDELAHWRQAELLYNTGKLYQDNPVVHIIGEFPGLSTLTVSLRHLSGLSTFQIGSLILLTLHICGLLGIFVIAERMTNSARIAALAAFIYSLNPSYMFFDTEYSYESVSIVFIIWAIAALVCLQDAEGDRPRQLAWLITGLVIAAASIITHHLSSYTMVAILLIITGVTAVRVLRGTESRDTLTLTAGYTGAIAAGAVAWLVFMAPDTIGYLTPYPTGAWTEIINILTHKGQSSRVLFSGSTTPLYEHIAAFLALIIVAVGAAVGLWLLRRQLPRTSAGLALILFGLLYFPSVPFTLTQSGAEGAHRSWAYTYIGLALLLAPVIPWLLQRVIVRGYAVRNALMVTLSVLSVIVLIGNVGMNVNETYRLPGPFVYGSDTRSLTPELLELTRWFRATEGIGQYMVTDRYSGLALAGFGEEWTSSAGEGFRVWQLYGIGLKKAWVQRPPDPLPQQLQSSGYDYLVVDKRMAQSVPSIGVYFEPDEPQAYQRTKPPAATIIDNYSRLPWTIRIYQSDNLSIYRFNFSVLRVKWNPVSKTLLLGLARHS